MSVLLSSRLWTRSGCGSSHAVVLESTRFRAERRKPVNNVRFFSSSRSALPASSSSTEKQRLATLRLYRILQRASRSFPTQNTATDPPLVLLQPPLKANDWGRHMIFKPPSSTMVEELFRLFYVMNDSGNDSSEMVDASSIDDWYYNVVGRNDTEAELPPMTSMTCWTTTGQIQEAIRTAFRASLDAKHDKLSGLHFWAIRAVQFMHEQQILWKNSSVATTKGVRVTATSRYGMDCECTSRKLFVTSHWKVRYSHSLFFFLVRCIGSTSPTAVSSVPPTQTSLFERKFRFAYRIRVENVSNQNVQLLGRYWCIEELTAGGKEDDTKERVVVDSPATGAVGHLPVLRPGQVFEYMSGTDLLGTRGIMKGHFYMAQVPNDRYSAKAGDHVAALSADDKFEVEVASFPLEANTVSLE